MAHLDLKVVLHRGQAVRQSVGSGSDLLGPAVTVALRRRRELHEDDVAVGASPLVLDAFDFPMAADAFEAWLRESEARRLLRKAESAAYSPR